MASLVIYQGFFFFSETGFYYVTLAVVEFSMNTGLALKLHRFACLHLPCAGVDTMWFFYIFLDLEFRPEYKPIDFIMPSSYTAVIMISSYLFPTLLQSFIPSLQPVFFLFPVSLLSYFSIIYSIIPYSIQIPFPSSMVLYLNFGI